MSWVLFLVLLSFLSLFRYLWLSRPPKGKPPIPPIALAVAAYLENEVTIIEKSLRSFFNVRGVTTIYLAWNGPMPTDRGLLTRLQAMDGTNGVALEIRYFHDSKSKAENLNNVMPRIKEEFVLLCDADDEIYPQAAELLYSHMHRDLAILCVQGRFRLKPSGNWLVWAADVTEHMIGFLTSIVCDFSVFFGHNGLWRKHFLLHGFDATALTEDFELSIRAHRQGHIWIGPITGECLAPPTYRAYLTQRARWWHGGISQWRSHRMAVMYCMGFAVLSYALWQTWWSVPILTYLLSEDWNHAVASLVGINVFILNIPISLICTLKRMFTGNQNFNVTPRSCTRTTSSVELANRNRGSSV